MEEWNPALNRAIADMVGVRVAVRSNPTGSSDCEDVGILEDFEYPWLRLRKSEREVICFPVYNIRLVKNLETLKKLSLPAGEALLRPAGSFDQIAGS
jgi:hypothetical protein